MSLALCQVQLQRGGRMLLDTAELRLEPGTLTAFCGPNGAGKTTALSVMAGVLAPDSGHASLDDQPLQQWAASELARRRAVVSQHNLLNFPFAVHEVVAMGRMPHQQSPRSNNNARVVEQCMDWLDLLPLARRNILSLSGGERQRVHIARALAQLWDMSEHSPAWLLLDEPTAALDLKYQLRLFEILTELTHKGWGVLAVLHELHWVQEHAQRVVLFAGGKVVADGCADDCLSPARVQQCYGLSQPYRIPA